MFRLVFVILRTKHRLILCHFPHCLLFLVFFMKVGYCCVYIITCSCFFKFQYWLDVNKTVAHQKKRESLYVCVCHCVCVCVGGGGCGVGACMNVCSCLYCFKYRKVLVCSKCYKYFTEKRMASYWPCFWKFGDVCGRKKSELLLKRIEWNHYNIMYRLCNQLR